MSQYSDGFNAGYRKAEAASAEEIKRLRDKLQEALLNTAYPMVLAMERDALREKLEKLEAGDVQLP